MNDLFGKSAQSQAPAKSAAKSKSYSAKDIEVLEGLEPVRRRPGMYIGGTDERALPHLVAEVLDNAMDEAVAGHATFIEVTLETDGWLSVSDNGRGIPVGPHPKMKDKSALEVVMTVLHAGGKFDSGAYQTSGGLHGVGVSVVNALSVWLKLRIWRDEKEHFIEFAHGDAVAPLVVSGPAPVENGKPKRGTEVTFMPSSDTFSMIEFDYATIEHRLRELAFLNSGVRIVLTDARHAEIRREELFYEGGLEAFVRYLDRTKQAHLDKPVMIRGEKDGITVETALWWNDSYHESVLPFTNNIPQRDGGTHLAGFRAALTRQVTNYAESSGLTKKEKVDLSGDDCREGLTAVLSVKVREPQFEGQTKEVLGTEATAQEMGEHYQRTFAEFLRKGVENDLLDPRLLQFDLARLAKAIKPERDAQFDYLGLQTLYDRYFLHVRKQRIELPQSFFMRVAMGLSLNEIDREARAKDRHACRAALDDERSIRRTHDLEDGLALGERYMALGAAKTHFDFAIGIEDEQAAIRK